MLYLELTVLAMHHVELALELEAELHFFLMILLVSHVLLF